MLNDIGLPGFILLALLALLLFGPSKLPGLGRSAGKALREVKREMNEIFGDSKPAPRKAQERPKTEEPQKRLRSGLSRSNPAISRNNIPTAWKTKSLLTIRGPSVIILVAE